MTRWYRRDQHGAERRRGEQRGESGDSAQLTARSGTMIEDGQRDRIERMRECTENGERDVGEADREVLLEFSDESIWCRAKSAVTGT